MTSSSRQEEPIKPVGSLADLVAMTEKTSPAVRIGLAGAVKIVILAVLFLAFHAWQFPHLVGTWQHNPNWSHGFLIPLFSLYLLYARRGELLSAPRRVCLLGLIILLAGIIMTVLGFCPIKTFWVSQISMVVCLVGLVLYLAGPAVLKIAWLPIVYLVLAMPIPEILYTRISTPLQELAASVSTGMLQLAGVRIESTASSINIISLSGQEHTVTVAEACSGMRSLLAYFALGVAWAYLQYKPVWQRVILVVSAVPVAVGLNVVRVTSTAFMFVIDQPQLGQDFMHEFMGIVMLLPALLILGFLSWLLQSLFVEVEDQAETSPVRREAAE